MIRNKIIQNKDICRRIKEIRGKRTLEDFGLLIGVKHPTVYRYETDRIPGFPMLLKIAEQDPLKRGVGWLTTGKAALYKETNLGTPEVRDQSSEMLTPDRRELIDKVKLLMLTADEETVDALKKNVEQFSRIEPKKKED